MSKSTPTLVGALVIALIAMPTVATVIGFEAAEGYTAGSDLLNQPSGTPKWGGSIGTTEVIVTAGAGVGGSAGLRITTDGSIDTAAMRTYDPADIAADASLVTYAFEFKPTLEEWGTTFLHVAPNNWNTGAVTIEIKQDAGRYSGFRWHHRDELGGIVTSLDDIYPGEYGDTWRPVEIEVNWVAETFQITYDGALMTKDGGPDYRLYDPPDTRSNLFAIKPYYFTDTPNIMYLDNLEITPEPGTMALLAIGGAAALIRRRRK